MIARFLPLFLLLLAGATHASPPNVLFIAVDDLRPQLGCYGETYMHTPHIDSLASQGRMFRNHYVQVPTCGASRYALMTGLRPTTASDDNNAFESLMPTSLPANPESWVDLLRRNGWHTAVLGKVTHEPDGYIWNFPSSYDIGRSSATFPDMRFSWNEVIYDHDKWGAQRYPLFAYADGTGRVSGVTSAWEIGALRGNPEKVREGRKRLDFLGSETPGLAGGGESVRRERGNYVWGQSSVSTALTLALERTAVTRSAARPGS
jgi:hypothetical protein